MPCAAAVLLLAAGYLIWTPGMDIRDGRHDRRSNGIWIQHGWLGDDGWFTRYGKQSALFRNSARIKILTDRLETHGIKYVFPHLCPCRADGRLPGIDDLQTERFLDQAGRSRVLPWIGGVLGEHCWVDSLQWRQSFVESAVNLLTKHPRLAGVHINIEPLPSGNSGFLLLLDELRTRLPKGTTLSVAAYPPPTRWHRYPNVHWEEEYYREVARRTDLMAVMMYDTALRWSKFYQALIRDWTTEVLNWAGNTEVLLGIPAYNDAGSGYHDPEVENLRHSLAGIHAGLSTFESLPANYRGICIYSDWEMSEDEWHYIENAFNSRHER